MLSLPTRFAGIILAFAPLFVHRSWRHAQNVLAARLSARQRRRFAAAAWYPKLRPTFADALAAVCCAIWR